MSKTLPDMLIIIRMFTHSMILLHKTNSWATSVSSPEGSLKTPHSSSVYTTSISGKLFSSKNILTKEKVFGVFGGAV